MSGIRDAKGRFISPTGRRKGEPRPDDEKDFDPNTFATGLKVRRTALQRALARSNGK